MMKKFSPKPDWKWGTPEGSREFDRLVDRQLTFREKLQWIEESETLALRMQASLKSRRDPPAPSPAGSAAPRPSE